MRSILPMPYAAKNARARNTKPIAVTAFSSAKGDPTPESRMAARTQASDDSRVPPGRRATRYDGRGVRGGSGPGIRSSVAACDECAEPVHRSRVGGGGAPDPSDRDGREEQVTPRPESRTVPASCAARRYWSVAAMRVWQGRGERVVRLLRTESTVKRRRYPIKSSGRTGREIHMNTARFTTTACSGVDLNSSIRSNMTAAARSRRFGNLAASAAASAVGISPLVRSVQ